MTGAIEPKIAFVRGPIVFGEGSINNEATPSIAFAYISGYIKKYGYDSVIVDAIGEGLNRTWPLSRYPGFFAHGLTFDEVLARIPKDSNVIGFSGMFSGEWPVLRDLITAVREQLPDALLIAGGEHATALTEYSLRDCPALDVCVRGEGERTFLQLVEKYAETGDHTGVAGTAWLDAEGQYCQGEVANRIREIDDIPWPNWPEGYLEKFWAAGKSYGVSTERDMPFMSSRGCPFRCTFCSNEQMWTTRYVLRDVEDVIAEIKHWIKTYDITSLQFYDLTAVTKKSWIIQFCKRLLEEKINIPWSLPSGTRSEALDDESLEFMHRTGCTYLVYAPESGSARTLVKIKKRVDLKRLTKSALTAKALGFVLRTNLIIGFPTETRRDVFDTLLFGLKMSARGIDEVPVFVFSPYPGTEIFRELQAQGRVKLNDAYFLKLQSQNGSYLSTDVVGYNDSLTPWQLGVLRAISIMMNYGVGYLLYPSRIIRTIRNLASGTSHTATVFEHRLRDMFNRKFRDA